MAPPAREHRPWRWVSCFVCLPALIAILLAGCARAAAPGPVTIRSLRGPPLLIAEPPGAIVERRIIARVPTAALATDVDYVYFGDLARDELHAAPKRGGDHIRIGERAPLAIAIGERITWIGAPGNVVLASDVGGRERGASSVLMQTKGTFTDVASDSRVVLVTDAMRSGGVLAQSSSVRTALDVRPLELAIDAVNAYVLSERAIHAVPRTGGAPRVVLEGDDLSGLEVAGGFIFTTRQAGRSRELIRLPTTGKGAPVVLERAVRRAPFAVFAEEVYFLNGDQPELRRVAALGGPSGMVARAAELARATALVVDGSGIYLATEDEIGPVVLGLPRPP